MRSRFSPQKQEIIELLQSLKLLDVEYPPELLASRRSAFIDQITQRKAKQARPLQDQEIIKLLLDLESLDDKYPPELVPAIRSVFIDRIMQQESTGNAEARSPQTQEIIKFLINLNSFNREYPSELLAERREDFIDRVGLIGEADVKSAKSPQGQESAEHLQGSNFFSSKRLPVPLITKLYTFLSRIRWRNKIDFMKSIRSVVQSWLSYKTDASIGPNMKLMRPSLVLAIIVAITIMGSLVFGNSTRLEKASNLATSQGAISRPILTEATSTQEIIEAICQPDSSSVLCSANGFHRHNASWVSNSADSWIRMDLLRTELINSVEFSTDNAGEFNIAVALSDNTEYKQIFDSKRARYNATPSTTGGIRIAFEPVLARFVKITFADPGTTIKHVSVFLSEPPPTPTNARVETITRTPTLRPTIVFTNTPLSTATLTSVPSNTPTAIPTNTPQPSNTPTTIPTNTLQPSNTPTAVPTNTLRPSSTPTAIPTDTPQPSDTPIPIPTDTPQPSDTPIPVPTNTLQPPDTPTSMPADTPTLSVLSASSLSTVLPTATP